MRDAGAGTGGGGARGASAISAARRGGGDARRARTDVPILDSPATFSQGRTRAPRRAAPREASAGDGAVSAAPVARRARARAPRSATKAVGSCRKVLTSAQAAPLGVRRARARHTSRARLSLCRVETRPATAEASEHQHPAGGRRPRLQIARTHAPRAHAPPSDASAAPRRAATRRRAAAADRRRCANRRTRAARRRAGGRCSECSRPRAAARCAGRRRHPLPAVPRRRGVARAARAAGRTLPVRRLGGRAEHARALAAQAGSGGEAPAGHQRARARTYRSARHVHICMSANTDKCCELRRRLGACVRARAHKHAADANGIALAASACGHRVSIRVSFLGPLATAPPPRCTADSTPAQLHSARTAQRAALSHLPAPPCNRACHRAMKAVMSVHTSLCTTYRTSRTSRHAPHLNVHARFTSTAAHSAAAA
jgi:hypothetical protein